MELWQQTACQMRDLVIKRQVSPVELVQAHLQRIGDADPRLHAFLTIREEALQEAEQVEVRLRSGEDLALAGLPIAIKDNINLAGARTSCGSRLLSEYRSPYTATVVERLRAAGAVIIGKTNMDEFAMGSSTEFSAYGPSRNPWDTDRVPGGSSGGSSAAVAGALVPLALGSDTGGSVRQPASFCGVVGLKPTYGRVSRYGLVAFASSLDQIGPMARNVADVALIMGVLAGADPLDATSATVAVPDYSASLSADLSGLRLGLPSEALSGATDPSVAAIVRRAIGRLSALGAIVEECSMPALPEALAAYQVIAAAEAATNLARYDGIRYGRQADDGPWDDGYDDLIASSRSRGFGQEVKRRILLGTHVLGPDAIDLFRRAEQMRVQIRRELTALFERYDALVTPTSPTVAFRLGSRLQDQLRMQSCDLFTVPANLAGIPAISIPCGLTDELPIGLHIMGRHFAEPLLLQIAYAYEQDAGLPQLPLFCQTVARTEV